MLRVLFSGLLATEKKLCIDSTGGVQVLCKSWGCVPSNPLLQKRAIIKIDNAIVKISEQLKNISVSDNAVICAELTDGVAYPDDFTDLQW